MAGTDTLDRQGGVNVAASVSELRGELLEALRGNDGSVATWLEGFKGLKKQRLSDKLAPIISAIQANNPSAVHSTYPGATLSDLKKLIRLVMASNPKAENRISELGANPETFKVEEAPGKVEMEEKLDRILHQLRAEGDARRGAEERARNFEQQLAGEKSRADQAEEKARSEGEARVGLEKEISDLNGKVQTLEGEVDRYKRQVSEAEQVANTEHQEKEALANELSALKEEKAAAESKLKELEGERDTALAAKGEVEAQLAQSRNETATEKTRADEAENRVHAAEEQLESLKAELSSVTEAKNQAEVRAAEFSQKLAAETNRAETAEKGLADERAAAEIRIKAVEEERDAEKSAKETAEKTLIEKEAKLAEEKQRADTAEAERDREKKAREEVEQKLAYTEIQLVAEKQRADDAEAGQDREKQAREEVERKLEAAVNDPYASLEALLDDDKAKEMLKDIVDSLKISLPGNITFTENQRLMKIELDKINDPKKSLENKKKELMDFLIDNDDDVDNFAESFIKLAKSLTSR